MQTLMAILNLIPALIKIIVAVEDAFPQSGVGGEKLAMVKDILASTYEGITDLLPAVERVINSIVAFANRIGAFGK